MDKAEIYQDAQWQYRWRLKALNGAIVACSGEGFVKKFNAVRSLDRLISRMHTSPEFVDLVPDRRRKA